MLFMLPEEIAIMSAATNEWQKRPALLAKAGIAKGKVKYLAAMMSLMVRKGWLESQKGVGFRLAQPAEETGSAGKDEPEAQS